MKTVRIETYDDLLRAIPPGKVLVMPTCWTGELEPEIDDKLDKLTPIITGFSGGRVLHPEAASDQLNLGRIWVGELYGAIAKGAQDARDAAGTSGVNPGVDVTAILEQVKSLRQALGTQEINIQMATDSLRGIKRARDATAAGIQTGAPVMERAEVGDSLSVRAKRMNDHARDTNQRTNAANKAYWERRASMESAPHPAEADIARQVRGQTHDTAPRAPVPPKSPPTTDAARLREMAGVGLRRHTGDFSKPTSNADTNKANRDYWDKRGR